MDVRDYLRSMRAHWVLAASLLLLGLAGASLLSWLTPPAYASSTQMFVSTPGTADVSAAYQGNLFSQQRVNTYAELLRGEEISNRVIDDLNLDLTAEELSGRITVAVIPETVLLQATVTDSSPERAQEIADALGAQFPALVDELERPEGQATAQVIVSVVQTAKLPTTPVEPNVIRNILGGLILGLLAGLGAAILRDRLDNTVKRVEDIEAVADASVIGGVLYDADIAKKPLVRQLHGQSKTAEAFRQIRTNLQFLNVDDPPRVLVVTSSLPGEGKTTTAISLALVLAQSGDRVALVEGDLRRPRVTQYLRVVEGAGLTNVLAGRVALEEVLQPLGDGKLRVLGSGPTPPNPSEMLGSAHMRQVISDLRAGNDYVIIDSSPLLPVTDGAVLAALCDGVLLVARHGATKREQLQQSAQMLRSVDAQLLGVVLNMVPAKSGASYGYGYGYRYESDRASKHTNSSNGRSHQRPAAHDTQLVPYVRTSRPEGEQQRH